jgi:hypothetical protein
LEKNKILSCFYEKLEQASIKEAAYLIAPMNIGEDYEYYDKVKHLLIIPEQPKTLEQIEEELMRSLRNS